MKFIKHSHTDIISSQIALGTDSLGTYIDESDSKLILNEYTNLGGNLIDTASVYADWEKGEKSRSEKVIGRWMKEKNNRHNIIISTKGGHHDLKTGHSRLSSEDITKDINASLENLKTDYIDFYFLHRDDKSIPVPEIADTLVSLVRSGKARYIGLSNWSTERLEEADKYCSEHGIAIAASQIQFGLACPNIGNIDPTLEIMKKNEFDYYSKKDISLFAFSAQSKGYFSKLYNKLPLSPKAEERYKNEKSEYVYNKLLCICNEYNIDMAQAVIAVLLANDEFCTIPIVGCKSTEQIASSLSGCNTEIDPLTAKNIIHAGLYSA